MGLEGIVSKRTDAPYRSGPSKTWLKSKNPASAAVRREREEAASCPTAVRTGSSKLPGRKGGAINPLPSSFAASWDMAVTFPFAVARRRMLAHNSKPQGPLESLAVFSPVALHGLQEFVVAHG